MTIEIKDKGSESFYRETVNVISQYRALSKKPEGKLKDNFKLLRSYIVICTIMLVILAAMAIAWGADSMMVAGMALLAVAAVFSAMYLKSLKSLLKTLMGAPSDSVLTLDEKGVELDKHSSQTVRLAWDNVLFARVFQESVCFLAKDSTGFVISVDRKYESEILAWIESNKTGITVIR